MVLLGGITMRKELSTDECMEIFKKYDEKSYEYYLNNMWFFGCDARNYARYLKEKNENGGLCDEN